MIWDNRKYVVLTADEVDDMESSDWDTLVISGKDNLPVNSDETEYVVKYEGSKPRFLYGKDTMTWAQATTKVTGEEWSGEE